MENHTSFNQEVNAFYEKVKDYVLLPDMRQSVPRWKNNKLNPAKCCFGARVARALCKPEVLTTNPFEDKYFEWRFLDGRDKMEEELQLNTMELYLMLWACGAARYPFSSDPWQLDVDSVMARFIMIEYRPTEEQTNYFNTNIYDLESEVYNPMNSSTLQYRRDLFRELIGKNKSFIGENEEF